jgi:hypothetical protein
MSPKKDLASVLADAQWLPAHWDPAADSIQLAWVPRDRHSKLTFLADQYLREIQPSAASVPMADVSNNAATSAPNFVFHSAFCCSTLLTRALDVPGVSMGLNEPQIVNELAAAALQRRLSGDVLGKVVGLLSRPFAAGERVAIKPSNEANMLAPALLDHDGRSRAIFLYAPLSRFLASVAGKGMWGRIWGRRLYASLALRGGRDFGFSEAERFELTDLQASALAWLLHQSEAADLLARFPERVRTLDSETLLARKSETLVALAAHFGLDAEERRWRGVAEGPVFQTHSKEIGRSFDTDGRSSNAQSPVIDEEIQMVDTWARAVAKHAGLAMDLPLESRLVPAA